jgi:hypothetical protein
MIVVELGDAIAVMPEGTVAPPEAVLIPFEDFALPLFVLWPAGRPSPAARRLTATLGSRA